MVEEEKELINEEEVSTVETTTSDNIEDSSVQESPSTVQEEGEEEQEPIIEPLQVFDPIIETPEETDPELKVKDWDDSIYRRDPNAVSNGPMRAAAATTTYRKLSGANSIAGSGVTIDAASGKLLTDYIKGNALYINGTKVIWYE